MTVVQFNPPISDGFLSNIEYINLRGMHLTEIPKWIKCCKNLKRLNAAENNITDIDDVRYLLELRTIKICSNPIDSLESLYYLDKLNMIGISHTNVSSLLYIPDNFSGTIRAVNTLMDDSYIKAAKDILKVHIYH